MMRYEKKVTILGGSLILLLAIWAAGIVFSPEKRAARSESRSLLSGKIEDAAAIDIGISKVSLAKEGSSWFLVDGTAKLPAQESRIKSFLEAAQSVKRLRPMAKSKDAWKSFELDEGKAKPVLVRDAKGKAIADFSLGGYGPTGAEVYLRMGGSDSAYAADSAFASYVTSGRKSWLDLRVMPTIPENDVEALAVKSSIALDGAGKPQLNLDYAIRRGKDGWSGIAGNIDSVAVSSLLRALLNLEGEDIETSPPAQAFTPVSARFEISLGNGGSKVVEVGGQAGDGRFYLRLAGSNYVYAVSAYGIRNALKKPADLLVKK